MKYFTKEWYELMQNIHYTEGFETLADKEFTDEDIKILYDKKLNEWINEEKEIYEEKPDYSEFYDSLGNKEFNPTDWLFVDEKKKEVIEPSTKEEVIEHLKFEEKQAIKEYNKRKPFDSKKSEKEFNEFYKSMLVINDMLPKWVYEKVDKRLIALGYLPQNVFNKLKEQEIANKEKYDNIKKEAMNNLYSQNISEEIYANFNFHDGVIKSFKIKDGNYIMKVTHSDFIESYTVTVIFKDANIIEMEDLKFGKSIYLYEEIYKLDNSYEVHIMYECDGLKYLTIRCSNIEFK